MLDIDSWVPSTQEVKESFSKFKDYIFMSFHDSYELKLKFMLLLSLNSCFAYKVPSFDPSMWYLSDVHDKSLQDAFWFV